MINKSRILCSVSLGLCLRAAILKYYFSSSGSFLYSLSFFSCEMMEWSPLIMVLKKQEIKNHQRLCVSVFCFHICPSYLQSQILSFFDFLFFHSSCGSPVVKVHDGLQGASSARGDVSLEAREQRGDHVHPVLLPLPVSKHAAGKPNCVQAQWKQVSIPYPPSDLHLYLIFRDVLSHLIKIYSYIFYIHIVVDV